MILCQSFSSVRIGRILFKKTTDYETTETIPVERLDARSTVVTGASTAGVP